MTAQPGSLHGRRILVAEDEYMIADELDAVLRGAGAHVVGPVSRVAEALAIAAADGHLDGAVLDVNLAEEAIWPVLDILATRRVPTLLTTGYDPGVIPRQHAGLPCLQKPAEARTVARTLARTLAAHPH